VEGSPEDPDDSQDGTILVNGVKKASTTILGTSSLFTSFLESLGHDVRVSDEVVIRDCIVLPHKELLKSHHNEIVM